MVELSTFCKKQDLFSRVLRRGDYHHCLRQRHKRTGAIHPTQLPNPLNVCLHHHTLTALVALLRPLQALTPKRLALWILSSSPVWNGLVIQQSLAAIAGRQFSKPSASLAVNVDTRSVLLRKVYGPVALRASRSSLPPAENGGRLVKNPPSRKKLSRVLCYAF